MIPKVIHYCWFGGNALPDLAVKCIKSWEKYCPYYEIREWNETNFDIGCCKYVQQAYEAGKWAFVSDYARFKILYENGGLYFDTDVELIKPLGDIVARGSFMGCEPVARSKAGSAANPGLGLAAAPGLGLAAAPGLGLAAAPGLGLYREILDEYENADFLRKNRTGNFVTVVERTTRILAQHGYSGSLHVQKVAGIYIYPSEYFCPLNLSTGQLVITENTRSIHHYDASWMTGLDRKILKIGQLYSGFGRIGYVLERVTTFPLRVLNKFNKIGVTGTVQFIKGKFKRDAL